MRNIGCAGRYRAIRDHLRRLLAVLFVLALVGACALPRTGEGGSGAIQEHSDLFVPGTPVGGKTIWTFETNDTAYWSSSGYTLWGKTGSSHAEDTDWTRTVALTKDSGDGAAGYGIVFGYVDDPTYGPTMLVVMINTEGKYCAGEAVGSDYHEILPWTSSASLQTGLSQANELALSYAHTTQTYSLAINGTAETTFQEDSVAPYHNGGADGFLAVISYNDNFPATPVRVVFEQ